MVLFKAPATNEDQGAAKFKKPGHSGLQGTQGQTLESYSFAASRDLSLQENMDDKNHNTQSGKVDVETSKRNSNGRKNNKLTTLFLTLLSSTQGE